MLVSFMIYYKYWLSKTTNSKKILVQGKSNVNSNLFERIIENLEDHYKKKWKYKFKEKKINQSWF